MNSMTAARATKSIRHGTTTVENNAAKPFGLLMRLIAHWHRWQRLRRDKALLLSQPDYLLRDIGIDRNEIEAMIRGNRLR